MTRGMKTTTTRLVVIAIAITVLTVSLTGTAVARPRPGAAADCAFDVVTILDLEAAYAPEAEITEIIDTLSLKCLSIGAKAEQMVEDGATVEEVNLWLLARVAARYDTTREAVGAAFCSRYGC